MLTRISHELIHAWFGLLIGAADWSEEWLSEGFATFLEDILVGKTDNTDNLEIIEKKELRSFIRWNTMINENANTEKQLQILRPNFGSKIIDSSDNGLEFERLKNGMTPKKRCLQIHYLKVFINLTNYGRKSMIIMTIYKVTDSLRIR